MLPVSYGLLITTVEFGMDGTSFQCISHNKLNDNDLEYKRSTLGILNVEKLTPGIVYNYVIIQVCSNTIM